MQFKVRLLWAAAVALAGNAAGWGPATHAHLARLITDSSSPDVVYGAMLPDCNAVLMWAPAVDAQLKTLLHDEFDRLPVSLLRTGMATHNSVWGADYYAHLIYHPGEPGADTAFSTVMIRDFRDNLGLTTGQAEDLFELTVDYLIRLDYGPQLGTLMKNAANASGPRHEEMLVNAFAGPLSARVAGLSEEDAADYVRMAAGGFQVLVRAYGDEWLRDEEGLAVTIPNLLAQYLDVDPEDAAGYLEYAVERCRDSYDAALRDIAIRVRSAMDADPAYAMPAARPAYVLLALSCAMLFVGARRGLRMRGRTAGTK